MIRPDVTGAQEDWWSADSGAVTTEPQGPVRVDHVVDFYRRYRGELVTFYTRLEVREPVSDLTLRIRIPNGLELGDYGLPLEQNGLIPYLETGDWASYLIWRLEDDVPAGTRHEYVARARVSPTIHDRQLESRAVVTSGDQTVQAEQTVSITVQARGSYLRYLPALYERDDLMARYLMLFESFWAPVEMQIDSIDSYFDPRITPTGFLPWLASWLDLELDENWPDQRLRQLIRWAIALHRSRGTKWGLLKYLEIYTGQRAEIVERRANNFVIGSEARLGPGIALGRGNRPHTFSVTLALAPLEIDDEEERERREKIRRRTIEAIIDMQKPAHTVYSLHLKSLSLEELAGQSETDAETDGPDGEEDELAAQAAIWFKLDGESAAQDGGPRRRKRDSSRRKGKKS